MDRDTVQHHGTFIAPTQHGPEDEIARLRSVVNSLQKQLSALSGAAAHGAEIAARTLRERHYTNGWEGLSQLQDPAVLTYDLSPARNDDPTGSSIKRVELSTTNEFTNQGLWNQDQDHLMANGTLPEPLSPSSVPNGSSSYIPNPSVFCLDILELEGSVRQLITTQHLSDSDKQHSFDSLIRSIFDLMVSKHYWHWTKDWWILTNSFQTIGLITRYRIEPTLENYARLPARFRPTRLQFTRFHWPVVDWIAWPEIRDKLILHAAEYDLSEVTLATMRSYCLEEDTNELPKSNLSPSKGFEHQTYALTGGPKTKCYYRLEEYIDYTKQKVQQRDSPNCGTPRTTISARLEAKLILALQAEETPMKLEPAFFERFPGLLSENAIAQGKYRSIFDAE
ncbi:hypothetical protein CLAIMM_06261 [Cladophialophora immunda]|nr:hypothetical protein CLAIMM_06261 [Cladophialophora immunda]